jgi:flagella basal body P-ring formation protein FlgA
VRVERESQEVSVEAIKTAVLNVAGDALPAGETVAISTWPGRCAFRPGLRGAGLDGVARTRRRRRVRRAARARRRGARDGAGDGAHRARGSVVVTKQRSRAAPSSAERPGGRRAQPRDVPDDALTAPEQAIGMETKVALAADAPLAADGARAPVVVKKGDLVTMIVETPAMRLTVAGEALEPGRRRAIKVMNRPPSRRWRER